MKNLFFMLLITISALVANDIQVFTSNSMYLKLDKGSQITKVFFGTEESFKTQTKAFNKAGGSIVTGFISSVQYGGGAGAAAGGLASLGAAAIIECYNSIVSDNNYILLSKAIDSKGNETLLETLIITNYKIDLVEAEKLATTAQQNLIEK